LVDQGRDITASESMCQRQSNRIGRIDCLIDCVVRTEKSHGTNATTAWITNNPTTATTESLTPRPMMKLRPEPASERAMSMSRCGGSERAIERQCEKAKRVGKFLSELLHLRTFALSLLHCARASLPLPPPLLSPSLPLHITCFQSNQRMAAILENFELDQERYVALLEKLIGESEFVQNNPPALVPQEDRIVKHVRRYLSRSLALVARCTLTYELLLGSRRAQAPVD